MQEISKQPSELQIAYDNQQISIQEYLKRFAVELVRKGHDVQSVSQLVAQEEIRLTQES